MPVFLLHHYGLFHFVYLTSNTQVWNLNYLQERINSALVRSGIVEMLQPWMVQVAWQGSKFEDPSRTPHKTRLVEKNLFDALTVLGRDGSSSCLLIQRMSRADRGPRVPSGEGLHRGNAHFGGRGRH